MIKRLRVLLVNPDSPTVIKILTYCFSLWTVHLVSLFGFSRFIFFETFIICLTLQQIKQLITNTFGKDIKVCSTD